jgi:prophage antirepressor-like protein
MQYQLQVFHDDQRREFRTLEIDGEPWFVLADACRALGIKNPSDVAARLDEDEKGVAQIETLGGSQMARIINESGLYSQILRSEKPEAKGFKKWITSEVLPSIRKTGGYGRTKGVSADWQPFHDRISAVWGAVPDGYFSVFKEMAELIGHLISQGVPVDHKTIPDISVGTAWGRVWTERAYGDDFGPRVTYDHRYPPTFPQSRSNPQHAYCYPEDALSTFRRWLRNDYLKVGLPKYIGSKAAKGQIAPSAAAAVLKALGAPVPTPRLR